MPAKRSRKKIAALCLAAALAGVGSTSVAHAETPAATLGSGLLAELAALWDAWGPSWASHEAEAADTGQQPSLSAGEPELGPYYEPSG